MDFMFQFAKSTLLRRWRQSPEWTLGLLALLWIVLRIRPEFQLDEERFVEYADNLCRGFYAPTDTLFLWNGPGLPLLLWPFRAWDLPLYVAKLGNALFFFGAVRHFRLTLQAMDGGGPESHSSSLRAKVAPVSSRASTWAWWVGSYFLVFDLPWLPLLMTETVALFCVAGAMRELNTSLETETKRGPLLRAAAYLAALALTRFFFACVLLAGLGLTLCLACLPRHRRLAKRLASIAILAFLICSPYLLYTYQLTGRFFYWGNTGGSQMYTLTLPEKNLLGDIIPFNAILEYPEISPSAHALLQSIASDNEVERDMAFRRAAWNNLRNHPGKVFQNWRANVNRLVFDTPFSHFPGSHSRQGSGNLAFLFSFWFYAFLPTVAIAIFTWRSQTWRPITVVAIGFSWISLAGLSLLSAYARFVLPLLPALALAMAEIWRHRLRMAYGKTL